MLIDHIFSWGVYFMFPSYGSVVVWCSNVLRLRLLSFWFLDCTTFLLRHSCHLISRDEEYDRGKRKKVRKSMRDFSGPNPFQEVENTRSRQRRRLQADQARSGHQPLRIWPEKRIVVVSIIFAMRFPLSLFLLFSGVCHRRAWTDQINGPFVVEKRCENSFVLFQFLEPALFLHLCWYICIDLVRRKTAIAFRYKKMNWKFLKQYTFGWARFSRTL